MLRKILLTVVGVTICGFLAWKAFLYQNHLRFVPEDMGVLWVRYVAEESWGFGPGGNETGIIVYDMPDKVREVLIEQGISWLNALPPNSWSGWQGRYRNWKSTPVPATEFWTNPEDCPPENSDRYLLNYPNGCPSISGYMGKYGFNISFDGEVEKLVNQAVFSIGAYYAYGRIGMLIVIPEQSRIVYVYNG